jgi:hypothetical protein
MEEKESSFLIILGDCPVGGSSVGGRLSTFLKNEYRFDCFILDFRTLRKWAVRVSLNDKVPFQQRQDPGDNLS